MRAIWSIATLPLCLMLAGTPANACATLAKINLNDVEYADAVVVGRVANYEIVRDDPRFPELRKLVKNNDVNFLGDYARFDILVDDVLRGRVPSKITVTWENSTFSLPKDMLPGPFLIALRDPGSTWPPLRDASATVLPNPAPHLFAVLQAPCAGPFIFESAANEADLVRHLLELGSE